MKQWKWQKAIVRGVDSFKLNNGEVWVKIGKPAEFWGLDGGDQDRFCGCLGYEINLMGWLLPHREIVLSEDSVEFLARGPEDFSDDVPLIPYSEWSKWT